MDTYSRHTRIVATLGPASSDRDTIVGLLEAGMNVARVNASHATFVDAQALIATLRDAAAETGRNLAILLDLPGPKLRVCGADRCVDLEVGEELTLTGEGADTSDGQWLTVPAEVLAAELAVGDRVLLADGAVRLEVIRRSRGEVVCRVTGGGQVRTGKGISLPDTVLSASVPTAVDETWLARVADLDVDWVAVSFTQTAADLHAVREVLARHGAAVPLVAKVERATAIEHLDAIAAAADALMVARGDLGVETAPELVPALQRRIIDAARRHFRPVITATEMLESMTHASRPTRAEVSDVANAVADGTDAVMLSGETAVGDDPVNVVATMSRIVEVAESEPAQDRPAAGTLTPPVGREASAALARAAVGLAEQLDAKMLAVFTDSGSTAQLVANLRPGVPVTAFTHHEATRRRLNLNWGTHIHLLERAPDTDRMLAEAVASLVAHGVVADGDQVVFVAGPANRPAGTDLIKVATVEID